MTETNLQNFGLASKSISEVRYTLGVGEAGRVRLGVINELYNASTQSALERVGARRAQNILEVACGNGQIANWLAKEVESSGGHLLGVDNSGAQLQIAREAARNARATNVDYQELSVFDLHQLERQFDLCYSRFVLVHITGADRAIAAMRDVLRPGGIVLCEEATASSCTSSPRAACLDRWLELWRHLRAANHAILDLGALLPEMFRAAGLVDVHERTSQPVLDTPSKRSIFRLNVIETKAAAVSTGFASASEIDDLVQELAIWEKSGASAEYMRIHQVWGVAPPR